MANHVKLLLVDDNPMVLGMLQKALSPLAKVTTSNDTADALLKAVDDPPDVLVSDYRMPGMDGQQLVEKLKSRPKTAGISVILLASKADITERFSNREPVDDFVEKPFFLKEATQRIKRVIDKIALEKMAKTVASDGVLRGSLAQMNVIDLVQSLEMGRKSCALTLTHEREKCEMYSSTPESLTASVLTISDSSARGARADLSGPAVARVLRKRHFSVVAIET